MKWIAILLCVLCFIHLEAQDVEEQELESLASTEEANPEDASLLEEFEALKKRPLNLNHASDEDLMTLPGMTTLYASEFTTYRKLFGSLLSLYELQAIPGWNIAFIRQLLPYITLSDDPEAPWKTAWQSGNASMLIRYGRLLQPPGSGSGSPYLGSADKISFRCRYNYRQLLSWGVSGEKDPGEPFMGPSEKAGFDFYSFHLVIKNRGRLETLVIGDFTANLGQGLIHWQSLAFKKSASVLQIKRQSSILRPYTSTGEVNFLRGAGITWRVKRLSASVFLSYKKESAHIDTVEGTITSFFTTGCHRTPAEFAARNNISHLTSGMVLRYALPGFQVSINQVFHRFSYPLAKREAPYQLFAPCGQSFYNASIDYSYTFKNVHAFGETAFSYTSHLAWLHGLMLSLDRRIDAGFLFRHVDPRYQAMAANAFTENTLPANEEGWYTAISIRPLSSISIESYADLFHFPWLRYRVDAPSRGKDQLLAITFKPNKMLNLYFRLTSSSKEISEAETGVHIAPLTLQRKTAMRLHISKQLNEQFNLQNRLEYTTFQSGDKPAEEGILFYSDLSFKPRFKSLTLRGRLTLFSIDTYTARIYTYQAQLPFMFSIPAFYGKGFSYHFSASHQYTLGRRKQQKLQLSCGWNQAVSSKPAVREPMPDETTGNSKTELMVQLVLSG